MSTVRSKEGLYVGFEVNKDRGLEHFVKSIPPHIGEPLDISNLSVTALYPEELSGEDLSRPARRQLSSLVRKIARKVSGIAVSGSLIEPNQEELVPHKKFAAIAIDPSEELYEAREMISKLVHDDMGISIPSYNPKGWHVTVARRAKYSNRLAPYEKSIPPRLTLGSAVVAVCHTKQGGMSYINSYMNTPQRHWRR